MRPRSLRTRIALVIALALLAATGLQLGLTAIVGARAQDQAEDALGEQARALVRGISRDGPRGVPANAREADRFIGDTRMVVRVAGVVVHWNAPVRQLEARAGARRGQVEVTLDRPDPSPGLGDRLVLGAVAVGAVGAAALVWFLSGGLARRMRRSMRDLADAAEGVGAGRLEVRARGSEDELGRLAEAFNRMAAELEAGDARQRAFLADVAHELRTPITAIEGFSAALSDGIARSPADRAESAEFIRLEAARLRGLVRDLQELTFLDLEPPTSAERVELGDLGRETAARLERDAAARGVALQAPDGDVAATADPAHVVTILSNLVANALAATPAGGSVRLAVARAGGEVGIRVQDTGRGIPAEHLPRVFDRLYRVEGARDREGGGGSGLGLSIVRRLAQLMGGRVTVRSAHGEGSAFTLWLPAAPEPAAAPVA